MSKLFHNIVNWTIKLCLLIVLFISYDLSAQINKYGLPLLKEYVVRKDFKLSRQTWEITQGKDGRMYFATSLGIMIYDGRTWSYLNLLNDQASVVRSLAQDENGTIYVGSTKEFGFLATQPSGVVKYLSISQFLDESETKFTDVWKMHVKDNLLYVQAFEEILVYKLPFRTYFENNEVKVSTARPIAIIEPDSSPFHFSFNVNNHLFVRQYDKGLHEMVNNKLQAVQGGEAFKDIRIYSILPYKKDRFLIATRENGFYEMNYKTTNNCVISKIKTNYDTLLVSSGIYNGRLLFDSTFVLGTLNKGILHFDKYLNLIGHYTKQTLGLADDYILNVYSNFNLKKPNQIQSNSLWFGTETTIGRIELFSPLRFWNNINNGASISVNDFWRYQDNLYVATISGVSYIDTNSHKSSALIPINRNPITFSTFGIFRMNQSGGIYKEYLYGGSTDGLYWIDNFTCKKVDSIDARRILQSRTNPDHLLCAGLEGLRYLTFNGQADNLQVHEVIKGVPSQIGAMDYDIQGNLWLGSPSNVIKVSDYAGKAQIKTYDSTSGIPPIRRDINIGFFQNKIFFGTGDGMLRYDKSVDKFIPDSLFNKYLNSKGSKGILSLQSGRSNEYWGCFYKSGDMKLAHFYLRDGKIKDDSLIPRKLENKNFQALYCEPNGIVWLGTNDGIVVYNEAFTFRTNIPFTPVINKIMVGGKDSMIFSGQYYQESDSGIFFSDVQPEKLQFKLSYSLNKISFEFAVPYFEDEDKTQYSYLLEEFEDVWSQWSKESKINYTNLGPGVYTFCLKAKNVYGYISSTVKFRFEVKPPWYRTWWAYLLFTILFIVLIWFIVKWNTRRLIRDKIRLELIVEERTVEIRETNALLETSYEELRASKEELEDTNVELNSQKEVIEAANVELKLQKEQVEQHRKSILDSIVYARRIQQAVLPPEEMINESLPEHFILYRPRDIVSGDYYWMKTMGNKIFLVAADCTGHGVPGAFMSMLGISFLNEIVISPDQAPHEILIELRSHVIKSLHQTGKIGEAQDGMDMAMCVIDKDENKLHYAGANNSLYYINGGELIEEKADKMPIGIYIKLDKLFTTKTRDVKPGDSFYIFSDGYEDQFGGPLKRKFLAKNFKQIILDNKDKPMEEQKAIFEHKILHWMEEGDCEQLDDILVIGVRL